jgi:two-component system, chemotaxis family, protein-glutamate methylesterase/glutaminase
MAKLRGLIVDDVKIIRDALTGILSSDDEIEIVGTAENGKEAVEKTEDLNPDFITMDLRMPVMNGLKAMYRIMKQHPTPILVVSDIKDSHIAFKALSVGAVDIISKSDLSMEKMEDLIRKVKTLSKAKVSRKVTDEDLDKAKLIHTLDPSKKQIIVIAGSTGGPSALTKILSNISSNFTCPILVAQHMADGFVPGFVKWLNKTSILNAKEGEDGEIVVPGKVYLSPTHKNMEVTEGGILKLIPTKTSGASKPSCNILLSSVASIYKEACVGIILTGAGDDGVDGIMEIKQNNGTTLAQDEKTSLVFGMAKEAINLGGIDKILPLQEIAPYLNQIAHS